jgi:SAM-dependent methyltransferase
VVNVEEEKIKKMVREGYAKIAKTENCCCSPKTSKKIGYTKTELQSVPKGANFSLGCGNPVALASLKDGEAVLDLGSGAGLDCFLAANIVGEKGNVIGVDMTPEMIDKARENCRKGKYKNVEFRLGEIENLPVADNTADVIISNCVINLSPNKRRVFEEAFRTLKPGGKLMVSDIVLLKELPETVKKSVKAYIDCLSGAVMKDKYIELIKDAGFQDVKIVEETRFPIDFVVNDLTAKAIMKESNITVKNAKNLASSVASIKVYGVKPQ